MMDMYVRVRPVLSIKWLTALCGVCAVQGATIDTTLRGNTTAGPYVISTRFIDTSRLSVRLEPAPDDSIAYTFVPDVNGLLFSRALDSTRRIHIQAPLKYYGLRKRMRLFEPVYADSGDSLLPSLSPGPSGMAPPATEGLRLSGYKSIGIAVGNSGQSNIDQGLDVRVHGDIAPRTQVSGHITDRSSSIGHVTREVSDLDRIYLTITHPHYTATVGDQYASWLPGGLLHTDKKIKGIAGRVSNAHGSVKGMGAVTRGEYKVQRFRGENGLQGPYYLSSGTGRPGGALIPGTVAVYVNGDRKQEQIHYTVDYEFGSITFTPHITISRHDIIRVEYEFTKSAYQRFFVGTRTRWARNDSTVIARGILWNEADNKNQPLTFSLQQEDIDSLRRSGDSISLTSPGDPIEPTRVDSAAAYTQLYYKRDTQFVWAGPPYDLYRAATLHAVSFEPYSGGGYVRDTLCPGDTLFIDMRTVTVYDSCHTFFRFTGTNTGTHRPARRPLTPPQRTTLGELQLQLRPFSFCDIHAQVLGDAQDNNLYSSRDDEDNTAAAGRFSVSLGKRRNDKRAVWAGARGDVRSTHLHHSLTGAYRDNVQWDDTALTQQPGSRHSVGIYGGITPLRHLSTSLHGGQRMHNGDVLTRRLESSTMYRYSSRDSAAYSATFFEHVRAHERSRHQRLSAGFSLDSIHARVSAHEQWRRGSVYGNYGRIGGRIDCDCAGLGLSQHLSYQAHKYGTGSIFAAHDTGHTIVWEQRFSRELRPGWTFSATGSHLRDIVYSPEQKHVSTLGEISNTLGQTPWGFSGGQTYTVTIERASRFVQEAYFVGEGLGEYTLDTTSATRRYVPEQGGAWIVTQREYAGPNNTTNARKSRLQLHWTLEPAFIDSGILADLRWRGNGTIEEQVTLSPPPSLRAWIPGAMSTTRAQDTTLQSARLQYRQSVQWFPSVAPSWSAQLHATPALSLTPAYLERRFTFEPQLRRRTDALALQAGLTLLTMRHEPRGTAYAEAFDIREQSLRLSQRYHITPAFSIYMEETAGRTRKSAPGYFAVLNPGLEWQPARAGWARGEYRIAYVDATKGLDYRQAGGYRSGLTQVIDIMTHLSLQNNTSLHGSYRAEFSEIYPGAGLHTLSTEFRMHF
jgi:hypothetical protein